jgi:hypothetical protein
MNLFSKFAHFFHKKKSELTGKNTESTPVSVILEQLNEPRPLPMGMEEFEEWSNRIISGACIPGATHQSQKFAIAEMIMHLGPTEDHAADALFIKKLRKGAVNQIAYAQMENIRAEVKARLAKESEEAKAAAAAIPVTGEVTPSPQGVTDGKVLGDAEIQTAS